MSYVITLSSPPLLSLLPFPLLPSLPFSLYLLHLLSSFFPLPPFLHLSFPPLPLSILVFFAKEPV